jgi:hypothetical protein
VTIAADIAGDCILPFCVPVCFAFDCTVSDPSPVNLFSGGLGPVYTDLGLDTRSATPSARRRDRSSRLGSRRDSCRYR